ncbi:MAG TPA: hypothetical protein VEQ58_23355 [Polyangiaceae bacterium]|nr:hypothetical protein [Polyangiaceae bacterium]
MSDRRRARRLRLWAVLLLLVLPALARAQTRPVQTRDVLFEWDAEAKVLYLSAGFRDVIDPELQAKLSRGLPTTIVLTAAIYRAGVNNPVPLSTTAHTCKVTWHVWEEAYRVEIARPGGSQVRWTTTVEGVLRRCADVRRLLAGTAQQIPVNTPLFCSAKVQINPLSPELMQKLKLWVLRPSGTSTAAPSDALFSTFTGLFLQRVGEAERELKFNSRPLLPTVVRPSTEQK